MSVKEIRILGGRLSVEVRADQPPVIEGHAAVFNTLSEPLGGFREKIAPGAFKRTLRESPDVRALVDHDASKVIGRTTAGTLEVREDSTGLKVRITPPDTSAGRDILASIRRGDIDQMSFGFSVREEKWEHKRSDEDDMDIRTLIDVDLFEVSAVAFPAYPDTSVAVRSHDLWVAGDGDVLVRSKIANMVIDVAVTPA